MLGELQQIAVLALATSAVSVTITRGSIFNKQRSWLLGKYLPLGKLVSCPYCLSHWVSAMFVAVYQPVVVSLWIGIDLLVSVLVIIALAAIVTGVITRLNHFEAEDELVGYLQEALEEARKVIVKLTK